MLFLGKSLAFSEVSSKEVLVLLLLIVQVVVSVVVDVALGVVSVVLPERISLQIARLTISPSFEGQITDRSSLVILADLHSSPVGLVVNNLSSEHVLPLLSEAFENVIGAHLHDVDFLLEAISLSVVLRASLEVLNLSLATSGHLLEVHHHVFALSPRVISETTIFVTKGLVFSVRIPVIVGLEMSVILPVRVVEVTPYPGKLRNKSKIVGHLSVLIGLEVVISSQGVQLLVDVTVDHLVSEVVVPLLLVVLRCD